MEAALKKVHNREKLYQVKTREWYSIYFSLNPVTELLSPKNWNFTI